MFKFRKNDHFLAVLVIFPKFFWQVKEWFLLELHDMIRVPQVVACQISFNIYFVVDVSMEDCSNLQKTSIFMYS